MNQLLAPTCLALLGASLVAQQPTGFDLDTAFAAACPPRVESLWTLIPWRHSLTDALLEAKRTQRPIYLYVNDGDVDSGRC